MAAVGDPAAWRPDQGRLERLLAGCSEQALRQRWQVALPAIRDHWARVLGSGAVPLPSRPFWRLRLDRWQDVLRGRLPGWPARG
jgi:hypothetical protein